MNDLLNKNALAPLGPQEIYPWGWEEMVKAEKQKAVEEHAAAERAKRAAKASGRGTGGALGPLASAAAAAGTREACGWPRQGQRCAACACVCQNPGHHKNEMAPAVAAGAQQAPSPICACPAHGSAPSCLTHRHTYITWSGVCSV